MSNSRMYFAVLLCFISIVFTENKQHIGFHIGYTMTLSRFPFCMWFFLIRLFFPTWIQHLKTKIEKKNAKDSMKNEIEFESYFIFSCSFTVVFRLASFQFGSRFLSWYIFWKNLFFFFCISLLYSICLCVQRQKAIKRKLTDQAKEKPS